MMQLHELCKYASELEWSGGGRGRAEAEGARGGQRWVEKGKGGRTMTQGNWLLLAIDLLHAHIHSALNRQAIFIEPN